MTMERRAVELDDFELAMELEDAACVAFDLADRLVERIGQHSSDPELSRLALNFVQQRTRMRRLRQARKALLAG